MPVGTHATNDVERRHDSVRPRTFGVGANFDETLLTAIADADGVTAAQPLSR
jgi:hypothetical protein